MIVFLSSRDPASWEVLWSQSAPDIKSKTGRFSFCSSLMLIKFPPQRRCSICRKHSLGIGLKTQSGSRRGHSWLALTQLQVKINSFIPVTEASPWLCSQREVLRRASLTPQQSHEAQSMQKALFTPELLPGEAWGIWQDSPREAADPAACTHATSPWTTPFRRCWMTKPPPLKWCVWTEK